MARSTRHAGSSSGAFSPNTSSRTDVTDLDATEVYVRFPLRWVLRIVATVIALVLIAWWLPFDELVAAIKSVPAAMWPFAIAAYLSAHLLGVVKWRLLVNTAGAALP